MVRLPATIDVHGDFPGINRATWRELVDKDLRGAPFEKKLVTHTYEGILVQPLYSADDWAAIPEEHSGFHPYPRGSRVLGVAPGGWDVRQERSEPSPDTLNPLILEDLAHGVTSVLLRFDHAARSGMDADAPSAGRLVGEDGAALYSLSDLRRVFEGVHLQMIGVALEAGAAVLPAAGFLSALWKEMGVSPTESRGAFNADPLAVLARDGRLPMSLENAMAQLVELALWTSRSYPRVTSVRIGSAPYHHAGASAAQDLAFSMATAIEYLRVLTDAGMSVGDASRQFLFSYGVGCNFFLAGAKLRAARLLWAKIVQASGGSEHDARMQMHVRPSKRVLTTRDPWMNMLRNTACLFASAVGGAEVVTSAPFDQTLGLPSVRGRRIARNTATILQEESHLLRVADPAGGAWYIEHLTEELCTKAWEILQIIESRGGMSTVLQEGWVYEQIRTTLSVREQNLGMRREAVIGVTEFPDPGEIAGQSKVDSRASILSDARKRLRAHRSSVDPEKSIEELHPPQDKPSGQLAGLVARAAEVGATLGQCSAKLFAGEPATLVSPVSPHPYAEPFERLRDASDEYSRLYGFRPRVCLINIGTPAESNARAGFSRGFFEAGGFEVIESKPAERAEVAAGEFAESGANIAVLCSTDDRYAACVSEFGPALRRAGARTIILAGNPGEHEQEYRNAEVDRFIYIKCDVLGTLTSLLAEEGVLV